MESILVEADIDDLVVDPGTAGPLPEFRLCHAWNLFPGAYLELKAIIIH